MNLPIFLLLLQHNLVLAVATSSFVSFVATVQRHPLFLMFAQPHPLFLILLQPHPLILMLLTYPFFPDVATTSSSMHYVSTTS